jgi:ABC-type multidrug transport system ATPase subunit
VTTLHAGQASRRLCARELSLSIGSRVVLDSVCFEAEPGEVIAIVGPNGAGKTTLLECIAGLRPECRGSISLGAGSLSTFSQRAKALFLMPDEMQLAPELRLGLALGLPREHPLVAALTLQKLLHARGSELSRGESKRAQLCAALASDRPVLLLDEPFSAFDPRQLRSLIPIFRQAAQERVVLLTLHQLHAAERVADRIALLAEGRLLAFGTPAELRTRAALPQAPFDDVFLALLEGAGA